MLQWAAASLAMVGQGADWRLHYEKSNFLETGRYEEAVSFCRRLDAASPIAREFVFGTSPEGREMVALLISSEKALDKQAVASSNRPLVVVQNGIHSGEIEGKDASLILSRELLIEGKHADLLAKLNILIIPVFSVDAHERFGPYNRINQNGPKEMGWRATAQNLNLNRDYVKADGGEMRALLKLLGDFKPDFYFDNHTTNGADYQYVVTLAVPMAQTLDPRLAQWSRSLNESVEASLTKSGFPAAPYFDMADRGDPTKGISIGDFGPRYSIGYLAARNRPSMLVETHMLKPYRPRVEGTYWTMIHTMRRCAADASNLKAMNRDADARELAAKEGDVIVLTAETTSDKRPFTFKGFPYTPYNSAVSGNQIPKWDRTKPTDYPSTLRDQYKAGLKFQLPAAYAVPAQWKQVHELLELHGLKGRSIPTSVEGSYEGFRFSKVRFGQEPFESRFLPSFEVQRTKEKRTLAPGTTLYPVGQVGAKLLAHLLEPEAPDSLVRWGFFNVVFEPKEYFEDYALEPIAVEMLRSDPKLRAEFDERLKDEKFAKDPRARLQFFFQRTPFWDGQLNLYPVVRLNAPQLKQALGK